MKKIILYGPPLAGKRTALELLGAYQNERVQRFAICGDPSDQTRIPRTLDGKIMYASAEEYGSTRIKNVGCYITTKSGVTATTVLTFSGTVWTETLWGDFVSSADAVALMLDSQPSCVDTNLRFIRQLDALNPASTVGCVCWTKMDLIGSRHDLIDSHLRMSRHSGWPAFLCSVADPPTIRAPIEWLMRQLRS